MACCRGLSQESWSPQIWAVLRAAFLVGTITAVTQGALFDTYLSVLPCGSNAFVGTVESIRGMVGLVSAVPLGWAADRWPKHRVLQCNATLVLVSAVPLAIGICFNSVLLVILGSAGISLHNQCFNGNILALLADLTVPGQERTAVLSTLQTRRTLGMASGPLVQLLLTTLLGTRTWTPGELHWVICSGLFLLVPYIAALRPLWSQGPAAAGEALEAGLREDAGCAVGAESKQGPAPAPLEVQPPAAPASRTTQEAAPQAASSQSRRWLIAVLVELAAIVQFLGSGMTFKFFPLFFKKDFDFSPSEVCLFALGLWLSAAGGSQVAPQVAKVLGRMPTVILSSCVAALLLFWVASGLPAWASFVLVLSRAAFSQSNTPIMQAMVLDAVPPRHRGKWSAVVSLKRTSFSVSAFIGGKLSDHHDYRYAFFITACMQLAGCVVLLPTALLGA